MNRQQRRAARAKGAEAPPSPRLQPLLAAGIDHHRAGRLAQAKAAYREILNIQPSNADALNLLGVVAHQGGRAEQAVELIGRALKLKPDVPLYYNNLGAALRALGHDERAANHYGRAVELEPNYAEAHNNLGNTLMDLDRPAEAARSYGRLLALEPNHADAHAGLGSALVALGRAGEAGEHFRRAVELDPRSPAALKNMANFLAGQGDRAAAIEMLERATRLDPSDAEGWYELGAVLREDYRIEDAAAHLQRAVALDPRHVGARFTLGLALKELGRAAEAEEQLRAALAIDPDDKDAHNSLGNFLKEAGRIDEAVAEYRAALKLSPDDRVVRGNLALTELALGDFAGGWENYLARTSVTEKEAGLARDPLTGDLKGRRFFLLRDQGLGDEIFFLRYVRELKARGAWIAYRTDPKIAGMVARLPFLDTVVGPEEEPDGYDALLSPGDLPYLLGMTSAEDLPPSIELSPLPELVEEMRANLVEAGPPPYIGVTWRAGIQLRNKLSKITSLQAVASALKGCPGTVVVLQRAPMEGELEAFATETGKKIHDMTALNDDLERMLALLGLLDDYVCVSNTNVHLRAGVGGTNRVLVPFPPDYRWMWSGDESPWFPGSPTYREIPGLGWEDAFRRLAANLETAYSGV